MRRRVVIAGLLGVMVPAVVRWQMEGLTGTGGKAGAVQCAMCAGWTVRHMVIIANGGTVRVGPLRLVAHRTGGHTPGGTSWTWLSCEGARCVDVVYADSQSPISADGC